MNKKGYFFTLTVVIVLILVSAYIIAFRNPGYSREAALSSTRIHEINRFISAVEEDAHTALFIAAYRSFLALDEEIRDTNMYIPQASFDDNFEELVIDGTLNGDNITLLAISSLSEWHNKTQRMADLLFVSLTMENERIESFHKSAWHVSVRYTAQLIVVDQLTNSMWNSTMNVTAELPVTNFLDPVYTVGTGKRYSQRITMSNHTNFPDDIIDHINAHGYVASNVSPSFLQRLQGDTSLPFNWTGIESLIDAHALADVGIQRNRTLVDWLYFIDVDVPTCHVNNTPMWVLIDEGHLPVYNAGCS